MVGTFEEAQVAATFDACEMRTMFISNYDYESSSYLPIAIPGHDGWFVIGKGSTRVAVLSPSNVIYKLHLYNEGPFNQREASYRKSLPDVIGICRVADSTLYNVNDEPVLAMEYIELPFAPKGQNSWDNDSLNKEIVRIEADCLEYEIYDVHDGNLGRDKDGTPVLIDYAG